MIVEIFLRQNLQCVYAKTGQMENEVQYKKLILAVFINTDMSKTTRGNLQSR